MLAAENVLESLRPLGLERLELVHGSTYEDNSTVIVIPTRGMIHNAAAASWLAMIPPMNQKKGIFFAVGDEVGEAYNRLVQNILQDPQLSRWRYLLTLEDDNIVPPDAHIRLLESIKLGFNAVGGLYFTKGDLNMPMAYGDSGEYSRTGVLEFRPRDVRDAVASGRVLEVNGLAMGCTLYRMELFREITPPWFVTVSDLVPEKGTTCFTQDLYFCERAKRAGKRFAVDCRVRVGHIDVETGIIY